MKFKVGDRIRLKVRGQIPITEDVYFATGMMKKFVKKLDIFTVGKVKDNPYIIYLKEDNNYYSWHPDDFGLCFKLILNREE